MDYDPKTSPLVHLTACTLDKRIQRWGLMPITTRVEAIQVVMPCSWDGEPQDNAPLAMLSIDGSDSLTYVRETKEQVEAEIVRAITCDLRLRALEQIRDTVDRIEGRPFAL